MRPSVGTARSSHRPWRGGPGPPRWTGLARGNPAAQRANPRSMIGVDDRGRLMLVVVDGRQAGYSEGLGIAQTVELMMKRLGAVEAMNLDGGGSSIMATAGTGIVNRPSDATGQRSHGNVIPVKP
ncbi:phosphodiester glycosidase family protein [Nonomuraea dietziae]|uniref:phosphodiester glycosidase family protein n=1 Tax=Nonomuraea dietziae TaxID=65515 RepID=UPI0028A92F98|nr:phosphodiester glycosidase family protein [Nonomuraea dietziae]